MVIPCLQIAGSRPLSVEEPDRPPSPVRDQRPDPYQSQESSDRLQEIVRVQRKYRNESYERFAGSGRPPLSSASPPQRRQGRSRRDLDVGANVGTLSFPP